MKSVTQGLSRGWLLLVLVGCLSGGVAYANPANCDDDMTEDQRWTAKLCSAHPGCALVFGIQDSCVKAKSFLSRFGMAGSRRASSLTDDEVGDALVASGVPRSGLSSCLFSFDRAKCLEFLSGGPKPPSAKEKADALAEQLNSGVYNTTQENSALGLNRQALRMCEEATSEKGTRDAVRAKERCSFAEKGVQNCMSRKQSHDELRAQLQSLIDDGSLGSDAARYRALASATYPECPTRLPGSGKTPQAALAEYLKFWDTPAADGESTGAVALPRRGGNSGGDRFRQAITQADQEERDRPAREARERAEKERIAAAEASLTPQQQRLANNFDERISAARQQCAASENSCNTGCLGIAAVGLISAFSRNSAGASAAGDQAQQCSSRCDQEKVECDRQVAALEQEKQGVKPQQGVMREPLSVASGGGSNPTPNQLVAYCEAEWNVYTDNGYLDITGWRMGATALKVSSEDLRSGAWFSEFRRVQGRPLPNGAQALADCFGRGVLAGRTGIFRTPSMSVKARIDGDTRGRQDGQRGAGGTANPCVQGSYYDGRSCRAGNRAGEGYAR